MLSTVNMDRVVFNTAYSGHLLSADTVLNSVAQLQTESHTTDVLLQETAVHMKGFRSSLSGFQTFCHSHMSER